MEDVIEMSEVLGMKKVVWQDGNRTKVVRGETVVEDFFVNSAELNGSLPVPELLQPETAW